MTGFLIIWVTMWAGNKYNDRTAFLLSKLAVASLLTFAYFSFEGPLEATFEFLNLVFATTWNAKEWRFRVALDMWIVWGGMLTAFAFIKIKEHRLNDRSEWPTWQRYSIIASAVTMVLYFAFELTRKDKFVYNLYHPYISIFPVLAYTVLRNSTPYLRSTSSRLFIYIGQCSLETFILQFYIYLSADTKGIIMLIPGGPILRPINFIVTSLIVRPFSPLFACPLPFLTRRLARMNAIVCLSKQSGRRSNWITHVVDLLRSLDLASPHRRSSCVRRIHSSSQSGQLCCSRQDCTQT